MRVAAVRTIEEANAYLEKEYLPWWNQAPTVKPAESTDAHRPLGKEHDLAAILSHVEQRQVTNDYTVHLHGKVYQIDRQDIGVGMRESTVRMEERLDGTIAVRFQGEYVRVRSCSLPVRESPRRTTTAKPQRPAVAAKRKSDWMKGFSIPSGPCLRKAIEVSNARG